jgi:hypothetical protein
VTEPRLADVHQTALAVIDLSIRDRETRELEERLAGIEERARELVPYHQPVGVAVRPIPPAAASLSHTRHSKGGNVTEPVPPTPTPEPTPPPDPTPPPTPPDPNPRPNRVR